MNILMEKKGRAAFLTFEHPPLNVLSLPMVRELKTVLEAVARENDLDFLVVRGSGERAFSAGVDIKDHTRDKVPEMLEGVHGAIRALASLPQITIALVRGACLGGGCEIATCCDFVLASEDSFFATPEILVGCYPPVALARFASQIGYHRAAEMILTGKRISAQEAAAIGLINRAVASHELEGELQRLLEELAGKSRAVLRIALKGLREISLRNFPVDLKRSEELYLGELLNTADVEEGVTSFLQKRPPRWRHR